MNTFLGDLKYGLRIFRRNPGFTAIAVVTLALGIGANAAIFSVVNTVLLQPPATIKNPDRVVFIWETYANRNISRGAAAAPEVLEWRTMSHSFEQIAAARPGFFTITGSGEPEQMWGIRVTSNFLRTFGVTPPVGRDFIEGEDQPGHDQEVILSYRLWQRRYGGDTGLIGKTITLNEKPYTLIGVLPRAFSFLGTNRDYDVLTPVAFTPADMDRDAHTLYTLGLLKPNVTVAQAQAEMETIFEQQKKQFPDVNQKDFPRVVQFQADRTAPIRSPLLILLAAVGLVLLIACANVANLMLARAASREREIAVRATLGAGRSRILRQLLTESILLSLVGGVLGIAVAYGGVELLRAMMPPPGFSGEIPRSSQVGINATALLFTLLISLAAGVLFGLAPAVQVSRSELGESLKEGSRGSTGGRRSAIVRSALVVSEMALSLMLLIAAGLLLRSFAKMMSEDLGIRTEQRIAMQVWLPEEGYKTNQSILNFYGQVLTRLRALPGVGGASAINFLPLSGWLDYTDFDIEGRPKPRSGEQFTSQYRIVDTDYVRTMGLTLRAGRGFTSADTPTSPGVAVINESLARRYWPNENPVGKHIQPHFSATRTAWQPQPKDEMVEIVGVVGDIRDWEWNESTPAVLYLAYPQYPSHIMRLVVRAEGDPGAMTATVRRVVAAADPNLPVTEIHKMDELLDAAVSRRRLTVVLLAIFGALATVLAVIGIYGVMAYSVSQRAHEIGIRMALGAGPLQVLAMVVGNGMQLAGFGMAIGLLGSIATVRFLHSELYGVHVWDPLTFVAVTLLLALVAFTACFVPARRATRVDPLVALRYE